ncbi:MAG: VOC family protein [Polyangiaceae bacterium]
MLLHHLALRSESPRRLAEFYENVVGLRPAPADLPRRPDDRDRDLRVWLACGATIVMIERRTPEEPVPDPRSRELVAFAMAADAREVSRARLLAAGVVLEEESDFSLYFRDPEGRRLALSHFPHPRETPTSVG